MGRGEIAEYLEVEPSAVTAWEWAIAPMPYDIQCKLTMADQAWEHKRL